MAMQIFQDNGDGIKEIIDQFFYSYKLKEYINPQSVVQNVKDIVEQLGDAPEDKPMAFDDIMAEFEDKKNTKTSFEFKLKGNDSSDDAEIYITNEDDLFLSKPDLKEEFVSLDNPFKDTLANSEALPKIKKLDVEIEENYIAK